MNVMTEIMESPEPGRSQQLRKIAAEGEEGFAVAAAKVLLGGPRNEVTYSAIVKGLPRWTPAAQASLLTSVYQSGDMGSIRPVLDLPRSVLLSFLSGNRVLGELERTGLLDDAIDIASIMLASASREARDVELLQNVLEVDSSFCGAWLGRSLQKDVTDSERAAASGVLTNQSTDPLLASSVAILLVAGGREEALEVVTKNWNELVDVDEIPTSASLDRDVLKSARRRARLVSLCAFIESDVSRDYCFKFMRSKDIGMANTAIMVAAQKWPKELLSMDPGEVSHAEHFYFGVAMWLMRSPEFSGTVPEAYSKERLNEARASMKDAGTSIGNPWTGFDVPPGRKPASPEKQ